MTRSTKRSVTIPFPVIDGLKCQQDQGTINYPSINAALVGLARYALIAPGPHHITEEIARFHPDDQDLIDDFLLAINQRGIAFRSRLLRHIAERVINGVPEPDPEQIHRLKARDLLELARRHANGDTTVIDELAQNQ